MTPAAGQHLRAITVLAHLLHLPRNPALTLLRGVPDLPRGLERDQLDHRSERTYVRAMSGRLTRWRRDLQLGRRGRWRRVVAAGHTIGHVEKAMAERAALVALLRRPGVSWSEVALDIQDGGSASNVLRRAIAEADGLFADEGTADALIEAAVAEIEGWQSSGIIVRAFFDDGYPQQLRAIREMPPILFTRGALIPDSRAIAVVGSREASADGIRIAQAVAASLARQGVTVVSGLAKGIDTAAHRAALEAGGRTVAVIGTGIRRYYPASNRQLQDHIADVGLVLSQFWPDATPTKQSFPMRNAVMSGYAAATVVVEAGEKSGARIQARLALQHGRPVVLTNQVMQHEWARSFAQNPGVHVVRGTAELLEVVDGILCRMPTGSGMEGFPDLVTL